jgi:hypothetical protein
MRLCIIFMIIVNNEEKLPVLPFVSFISETIQLSTLAFGIWMQCCRVSLIWFACSL